MTDRPQTLRSGGDSVNLQAGGSISVGLGYSEIRQVCMDLFDLNYDRLLGEAKSEAARRAGEVADAFVAELRTAGLGAVTNLNDPGIQRALLRAQFDHAATGDADEVELYAKLLMQKLACPGKSVASVALQQAIDVVGHLSQRQIDLLSCLFVMRMVRMRAATDLATLRSGFRNFLGPLTYSMPTSEDDLRQLDASSCLAFDTTRAFDYSNILRANYGEALGDQTQGDLAALIGSGDENLAQLIRAFTTGEFSINSCFLSPRGIAVAHGNLCRRLPDFSPLSVWLPSS